MPEGGISLQTQRLNSATSQDLAGGFCANTDRGRAEDAYSNLLNFPQFGRAEL